jgi:hypothetical protein
VVYPKIFCFISLPPLKNTEQIFTVRSNIRIKTTGLYNAIPEGINRLQPDIMINVRFTVLLSFYKISLFKRFLYKHSDTDQNYLFQFMLNFIKN